MAKKEGSQPGQSTQHSVPAAVAAISRMSPAAGEHPIPLNPEATVPVGIVEMIEQWARNAVPSEEEREAYAHDRPIVLDEARCRTILAMVAMGNDKVVACRAAGIDKKTYYAWRRRFQEGDPEALKLGWFWRALDQGEAICETLMVAGINQGGWNWQSRAWMLERKFGDRWRMKSRDDGGASARKVEPEKPLAEMNEEELAAHVRRLEAFDKQRKAPR